ncbi:TIGR02147 family protein [Oligoflexus tunisiensis]|uniref:TIGR02147 family protein n=1 Tax=Oligoflexus tunisiensis TaxID=708132 RepID=UPI00114C8A63|nr:TIGR02147 family protein [Oligoflexus tunisiensis]
MKIHEYTNHRSLIRDLIQANKKAGHDITSRKVAEAAGVTGSFLSQALSEKQEFSNDQVFAICRYFDLSQEEAEYAVLLNEYARSQSKKRKQELYRQIEEAQHDHLRFVEYVHFDKIDRASSPVDDYLCDTYAPVVDSYMEEDRFLKNPEALRKKLGLSPEQFDQALDLNVKANILGTDDKGYHRKHGELMVYKINLAAKYNAILSRLKTVEKIYKGDESDFVGTLIFCANDEFVTRIKAEILTEHNELKNRYQSEPEKDDLLFVNLDLFCFDEL